jgi:hypothetical protein
MTIVLLMERWEVVCKRVAEYFEAFDVNRDV